MTPEKIQEVETEIEGIEFALKDANLALQVALKRLDELKNTVKDKPLDEF